MAMDFISKSIHYSNHKAFKSHIYQKFCIRCSLLVYIYTRIHNLCLYVCLHAFVRVSELVLI